MADTNPPTVPETVPPTDGLLDNVDFSALAQEEPAAETAAPAEVEAKEEKADEPAAEAEAADDAGAAEETTTEETATDEPVVDEATPAKPAEEKPAAATPTPEDTAARQAEEQRQARTTRLAAIKTEISALKAIPVADRDPFEHSAKLNDLLAEKDELRDQEYADMRQVNEAAAATARVEAGWQKWEREYPDVGAKGRQIWDEEFTKASKKYPNSPDAATAVAQERWEDRVRLVRAKAREGKGKPGATPAPAAAAPAKAKAPAPAAPPGKPAPTKGGSTLIPKGGAARPVVQPNDPVAQLAAAAGGGLKGFLD